MPRLTPKMKQFQVRLQGVDVRCPLDWAWAWAVRRAAAGVGMRVSMEDIAENVLMGSAYTDASREFGGVVPPLPSVLQPTPK